VGTPLRQAEDLTALLRAYAGDEEDRAKGGLWALAGFEFQLLVALADFAAQLGASTFSQTCVQSPRSPRLGSQRQPRSTTVASLTPKGRQSPWLRSDANTDRSFGLASSSRQSQVELGLHADEAIRFAAGVVREGLEDDAPTLLQRCSFDAPRQARRERRSSPSAGERLVPLLDRLRVRLSLRYSF